MSNVHSVYIMKCSSYYKIGHSKNPENRCYYCKKELLKRLQQVANELGFKAAFEGTNFSDLNGHRRGFKAVQEMENVYSPWAATRFTKKEIHPMDLKSTCARYVNELIAPVRLHFETDARAKKLKEQVESFKVTR